MNEMDYIPRPAQLAEIEQKSRELGFELSSTPETGMLLRTLAASKPGGKFLEIGAGLGHGTAWILSGMDGSAHLLAVEKDFEMVEFVRRQFVNDSRIDVIAGSAGATLANYGMASFDIIFADARVGKYEMLDEALAALKPGGLYVVDDMNPQPHWPDDAPHHVPRVLRHLQDQADMCVAKMNWSTGIVIAAKKGAELPKPPPVDPEFVQRPQRPPVTHKITKLLGWGE